MASTCVQTDEAGRLAREYLGALEQYLAAGPLVMYLHELLEDRTLLDSFERAVRDVDFFRTKRWASVFELGFYRIANYVLARALKPGIFMETGVLHGLTSGFILAALARNGDGRLISIDYPSYYETGPVNQDGYNDTLPPGLEPGWVIREDDKSRWQLVIGKSVDEMPKVLEDNPQIDIFLHDSEHTYETMWGEFNLAWGRLRPGGVLVCDNICSNDAFGDFCSRVDRRPLLMAGELRAAGSDCEPRFGLIQR